jgi:hypothetical protein
MNKTDLSKQEKVKNNQPRSAGIVGKAQIPVKNPEMDKLLFSALVGKTSDLDWFMFETKVR